MGDYTLTEQEQNDLRELFFTEACEILQALDQEVLKLESGTDKAGALRTIQRYLHTLKGNSRALGFSSLNTLSHKAEDLLKTIQDTSAGTNEELIDLLLAVHDRLQSTVENYRSNNDTALDKRLVERIDDHLNALETNGKSQREAGDETDGEDGQAVYDIAVAFDRNGIMKSSGANMILERLGALGEVISVEPAPGSAMIERAGRFAIQLRSQEPAELIKELITIPQIVKDVEITLRGNGSEMHSGEGQSTLTGTTAVQSLRVDSGRIDKILNLVGELVIGRSMIGQVLAEMGERNKKDDLSKKLGDANAFMEKTLSQLQKNVMKIRMLPVSLIFRKFPRVVRDLSLEQGKQIELVMEGENTELDKSILDVIGEPLIHLVRNAVDHGIELPDERERTGKPRTGKVTLRAYHESNQFVIDVVDDGKGLDPSLLRKKAVEKGIWTADEAARLTDEEALDLIFLSGFSTAAVVTDISGRGLGMDIVRTTVESLKGRIKLHALPGLGSTFTIRLPLTLAIIRAMLFRIGDRLFALPMSSIDKIVRIRDNELQTIAGKSVLRHRDNVVSLVSLDGSLGIRQNSAGRDQNRFVIIVSLGDRLCGFVVDRLVGQQELVIKALDNHWGTVNCTAGASILGNGRVVLILDAPSIILKEARRALAGV